MFLKRVIEIQDEVNTEAIRLGMPVIDILNQEEIIRIHELIDNNTWPQKWSGKEPRADVPFDIHFSDGSTMETLFK